MDSFRAADGRALAYRVVGSGPMLVCHPGGPGFSGAELDDLGGLSAHRTLVILDPRGSGGSDLATEYSLDGYARDLEALRTHLGLEPMDLLGFSHGAIVSIVYAARYPDGVGKLVLAGGIAAMTDETRQFAAQTIDSMAGAPWHADAVAALAEEESGDIDDLAALWQREAPLYFARWDESYRPRMAAAAAGSNGAPLLEFNRDGFDVRGELAAITAPTLVIAGREDFICGPPAAAEIANGIATSRTVVLEGTGHMMFVEQPKAFRDAVESFLAIGG